MKDVCGRADAADISHGAAGEVAGRDHMTKFDGQEDSWDKMEDYLASLVDPSGTASGT